MNAIDPVTDTARLGCTQLGFALDSEAPRCHTPGPTPDDDEDDDEENDRGSSGGNIDPDDDEGDFDDEDEDEDETLWTQRGSGRGPASNLQSALGPGVRQADIAG